MNIYLIIYYMFNTKIKKHNIYKLCLRRLSGTLTARHGPYTIYFMNYLDFKFEKFIIFRIKSMATRNIEKKQTGFFIQWKLIFFFKYFNTQCLALLINVNREHKSIKTKEKVDFFLAGSFFFLLEFLH